MKQPFALATDRICLRAPELEDVSVILQLENEADELEASPALTSPYSHFQIQQYILQNTNDIYTDREQRYIIVSVRQHEIIGIVDVFNFDPYHRRAEVGILIRRQFRCQGLATEALQLIEEHCFGWIGMHQLYAYIRTDNLPCLKLFLRRGFVQTGRLTDWLRYGNRYCDVGFLQKITGTVQLT